MKTQDILQSLKQLGELRAQGVLSDEEFTREKAALMGMLQQARSLAGAYPAAKAADTFATGFVGTPPTRAPASSDDSMASVQRPPLHAPASSDASRLLVEQSSSKASSFPESTIHPVGRPVVLAADLFATGYAAPPKPQASQSQTSEETQLSSSTQTQSTEQALPFPFDVSASSRQAAKAADLFSTGGGMPEDTGAERMRGQEGVAPVQGLIGGRYQRIAALGRGGMGEIWHVRDIQSGQEYALKALHDGLPQMREMFVREFQSLQRLRHPHIVRLDELGRDPALGFFFTMELLRGEDLQTFLDRAKTEQRHPLIAPSVLIEWVEQIAQALDSAHAQGILHLDLKPANIFLCQEGVRLIDFGIAQMRALASGRPTMGTVYYMAPEQLSGDAALSAAADVYALGVVVYQMLTGKIFQGGMPGPAQIERSLPRALDAVHEKATCWPPTERFQKPSALAEALRRALQSAPITPSKELPQPAPTQEPSPRQESVRPVSPDPSAVSQVVQLPNAAKDKLATWPATHWTEIRKGMDRKRPRWLQTPFLRKPPQLALASALSDEERSTLPIAPLAGSVVLLDRSGKPLLELCAISGGTYIVGAEKRDKQARRSEKPYQKVEMTGFWMARTLITCGLWRRFLEESGYEPERADRHPEYLYGWTGTNPPSQRSGHPPDHPTSTASALLNIPVTHLSALHAWAFCDFYGVALPSEAQWEAAARGPQAPLYPWGDTPPPSREHGPTNQANLGRNTHRPSFVWACPEGASAFGLLDAVGNVRQWVADAFDATWLQKLHDRDPVIPSLDRAHFISTRGSESSTAPDLAQTYRRSHEPPDVCLATVGFRPCLDIDPLVLL
ncbi:SUMF1/EgtB/PvdO family nonheme iron enzyme [Myxococcota bacterium]|nr:SUMF1/EgtB/PvdO family nonheme iron enzyme [Myxococcota bacterium]